MKRLFDSATRPRLTLLLVALLLAGLLAACESGADDEETPVVDPTSTVESVATDPTPTEPAAEPTATGVPPTPTTEPTATPVPPTPTTEPTATPEPTPTPEPTATPVPPTPTPEPTAVPPTPTPVPPPTPAVVSGFGQELTGTVFLQAGLGVFTLNHDGGSNFIIWLYEQSTGDQVDLLVNEIGPWSGSMAIEIPTTGEYLFEVNAGGNWSIEVLQPSPFNSAVHSTPFELSGSGGQAVYFLDVDAGLHRVTATHNGSSNFIIWAFNSDASSRNLLVNEIGPFDGSVALSVGSGGAYVVLDIHADGDWTIRVE